ncbi:MAG: hypothetical protein IKH46_09820 [Lachnospiraceae bacterium]|nr:hypothetical protein [Lachnospiraceae bacterium]
MKDRIAKIPKWGIMIILFLLAVLMEISVFQVRFWTEGGREETEVPLSMVWFQDGAEISEAGALLSDQDGSNVFQVDLRNVTVPVSSILLQAECTDGHEEWWNRSRETYAVLDSRAVWAKVILTRGGENKLLKDRMLCAGAEDSIRISAAEDPDIVTVMLSGVKGHTVLLKGIMLNTRPAFHFSWSRVAAAFGVFLFLRMFWPQSVLWTKRLWDEQGHLDKHVLFAMIITLVLLFPLLMFLLSNNTVYLQSEGGFAFYRELAHALAEGHTEIGLKVSPELLAMEDPYDPVARLEQEVPFYLDYAFYHGKYYVYFGVIPCLLFYLPLYALFGVDVPGWLVLVSLVWLIVLGNALLLLNMAKRYRPDLSQAVFGLLWVAGTAVYSLPSVLGDACNYYIPQLSGIVFVLYGLLFYFRAAEKAENTREAGILLAAGSFLTAFTAGARPQMVLGAVVSLPVIFPLLFRNVEGRKRPVWGRIACYALPYLLTAAGLMLYNYVRFGSGLEFGTKYNLTFAYVNQGGLYPETAGAGLFYYLLRPFHLTGVYPYLQRTLLDWNNPGLLANHPSIGGLYILYPVLWAGMLLLAGKSRAGERTGELYAVGRLFLAMVPVLVIADALMGGLMDRYKLDFAVFAAAAMGLGVMSRKKEILPEKGRLALQTAGVLLTLLAAVVSALTYAAEGVSSLLQVNPEAYAQISHLIEFWK